MPRVNDGDLITDLERCLEQAPQGIPRLEQICLNSNIDALRNISACLHILSRPYHTNLSVMANIKDFRLDLADWARTVYGAPSASSIQKWIAGLEACLGQSNQLRHFTLIMSNHNPFLDSLTDETLCTRSTLLIFSSVD